MTEILLFCLGENILPLIKHIELHIRKSMKSQKLFLCYCCRHGTFFYFLIIVCSFSLGSALRFLLWTTGLELMVSLYRSNLKIKASLWLYCLICSVVRCCCSCSNKWKKNVINTHIWKCGLLVYFKCPTLQHKAFLLYISCIYCKSLVDRITDHFWSEACVCSRIQVPVVWFGQVTLNSCMSWLQMCKRYGAYKKRLCL